MKIFFRQAALVLFIFIVCTSCLWAINVFPENRYNHAVTTKSLGLNGPVEYASIPDLTLVIIDEYMFDRSGNCVKHIMKFTLSGNNITTTYQYDNKKQMVGEVYEASRSGIIERINYINNGDGLPITSSRYKENGDLASTTSYTYIDGLLSEVQFVNTKGEVTGRTKRKYDRYGNISNVYSYKGYDDFLSATEYRYDYTNSRVWDGTQIKQYNDKGLMIATAFCTDATKAVKEDDVTKFTYEYDGHGNWIKRTGVGYILREKDKLIERTIKYYE